MSSSVSLRERVDYFEESKANSFLQRNDFDLVRRLQQSLSRQDSGLYSIPIVTIKQSDFPGIQEKNQMCSSQIENQPFPQLLQNNNEYLASIKKAPQ